MLQHLSAIFTPQPHLSAQQVSLPWDKASETDDAYELKGPRQVLAWRGDVQAIRRDIALRLGAVGTDGARWGAVGGCLLGARAAAGLWNQPEEAVRAGLLFVSYGTALDALAQFWRRKAVYAASDKHCAHLDGLRQTLQDREVRTPRETALLQEVLDVLNEASPFLSHRRA